MFKDVSNLFLANVDLITKKMQVFITQDLFKLIKQHKIT